MTVTGERRPTDWVQRRFDCPLCGPAGKSVLGMRGGHAHRAGLGIPSQIVQCDSCSLIFADPMPFPARAFAQYHDPHDYFRIHSEAATASRYEARLRYVERRLGRRGRVLDVGCGRGGSLIGAQRAGWVATGVEPAAEFARYAREEHNLDVRTSTLEQERFADEAFDCVTMGAVLEHVYDPLALLTEAGRVLTDDGLLYLGVPNERGLYYTLGNLFHRVRRRDWVINLSPTFEPYHVLGWSVRSLKRAFWLAGLEPVEVRTSGMRSFFRAVGRRGSTYERISEIVDLVGGAIGSGSQMTAWARKAVRPSVPSR